MDNQTTEAWHPITAEYDRSRSAWLVLFARYSEAGWQFAQRVIDPETMLRSEHGETA